MNKNLYRISFYVPESHLDKVKEALFLSGAGRYEKYDCCCWQVRGEGQFRPLPGSNPSLGQIGVIEKILEYKVEMICQEEYLASAVKSLKETHPYEEPAFEIYKIEKMDILSN